MKSPHKEVIVLIGKPGSGKGTQAEPLAKALGIPCVSVGKILREEIKKKTAIGARAAQDVAAGRLVPFELTVILIKRRLENSDAKRGIVLDGFPRQLEQAKALERIAHVTHAVLISITDQEVLKRLTGRRVCSNCGRNYHVVADPPKKEGVCNVCGHKLQHRHDDKASVIRERLRSYREETIPVLRFYRQRRALRRIEGIGGISAISARVVRAIKESDKGIRLS